MDTIRMESLGLLKPFSLRVSKNCSSRKLSLKKKKEKKKKEVLKLQLKTQLKWVLFPVRPGVKDLELSPVSLLSLPLPNLHGPQPL